MERENLLHGFRKQLNNDRERDEWNGYVAAKMYR